MQLRTSPLPGPGAEAEAEGLVQAELQKEQAKAEGEAVTIAVAAKVIHPARVAQVGHLCQTLLHLNLTESAHCQQWV